MTPLDWLLVVMVAGLLIAGLVLAYLPLAETDLPPGWIELPPTGTAGTKR